MKARENRTKCAAVAPQLTLTCLLVLLAALTGCSSAGTSEFDRSEGSVTNESSLTASQRKARATQIRDAAAARGITTGFLLAGIANAETQMAHCWSELTWACQGPASPDCGGGPLVAGSGDGACSLQQGGLGMFQFDAGTFSDTLAREGSRILTVAGSVAAAIDFVIAMVKNSAYVPNVSTDAQAVEWLNSVRVDNARFGPWVQTVTRYYNGCQPGWSCWSSENAHYRNNTTGVWTELGGAAFWLTANPPQQTAGYAPMEVYWHRNDNGAYDLRALAPGAVQRVVYRVDGYDLASATRSAGQNFPASYTFTTEQSERLFEVLGFDGTGKQVGRGVGLIDVTPGTAVYIKQMGASLYEIGLERAPSTVASIEVSADSYLLTDSVSGKSRSTRLAVRNTFSQLGPRHFEIRTYNANGTLRGTLRRDFNLPDNGAADITGSGAMSVPYFYQYNNTYEPSATCGLTSAAMLLRYWGKNVTPDGLYQSYGKGTGQSPPALQSLYQAKGLYAASTYTATEAQIKAYLDASRPVVVHGNFTSAGHVVVLVGYDASGWFVNDPAGQWAGCAGCGYPSSTQANGRGVHYSFASVRGAIGSDGNIWMSVASDKPL